MADATTPDGTTPDADTAATGTYELLRDRLGGHAAELGRRAAALNDRRLELFGTSELALVGAERIRTEHNCVARDIVHAGGHLLFGYNVTLGLKAEKSVADVFSLHRMEITDDGYTFSAVDEGAPDFLADPEFVADFNELHHFYRDARLLDLRSAGGKLLAVFQTGATLADIRAFRWSVSTSGEVEYLDDRGERDYTFPPKFDFEWTLTTRDDHGGGRRPHISICDEVFVDTTGGHLELRVEDNSPGGRVVFSEPVEDLNQSLTDAQVDYARLGTLILVRVRPYRESVDRYLVFNTRTRVAVRIDAIGQSCQQLPEDHGIIFPGGFYLQSGDTRVFDLPTVDMELEEVVRAPNGEDVLYVFHRRDEGRSLLLSYNMVRREVAAPIPAHGVSLFDDGTLVVFRDPTGEATRVHQMQVWRTPFVSDTHHAATPPPDGYLARVGNAELVRGISDALALRRLVEESVPSRRVYEDLIGATRRAADAYHWYGHAEAGKLGDVLAELAGSAELIVDEFAKVTAARERAGAALEQATRDTRALLDRTARDLDSIEQFSAALSELRQARGHLATLRDIRAIDLDAVAALDGSVAEAFTTLSTRTVEFLSGTTAFLPFTNRIAELATSAGTIATVADATPIADEVARLAGELELLTEVVAGLDVDDATVRTGILESISATIAALNQARALLEARRADLERAESSAAFGAEFALFAQSVTAALAAATTPERSDEQLGRLMAALENLESNYGATSDYLDQIATKREDVYEALTSRKQALVDERTARSARMVEAATRILDAVVRRASSFERAADLAGFFAADPMVAKVRSVAGDLRALGEVVAADELDGTLAAARTDAARVLRDRTDLFEAGGDVIRLGRHRFSVNTRPIEVTMAPTGDRMDLLVTGTDFRMPVDDPDFAGTKPYWPQLIVSETDEVYRAEYLAASMLADAVASPAGVAPLVEAAAAGTLDALVRSAAESRYDEGYERGVHDHDAAAIVTAVAELWSGAELCRYTGDARTAAVQWWHAAADDTRAVAVARSSAVAAFDTDGGGDARRALRDDLALAVVTGADVEPTVADDAADYLVAELAGDLTFVATGAALDAVESLRKALADSGDADRLGTALAALAPRPALARQLAAAAIDASVPVDPAVRAEAVGLVVADVPRRRVDAPLVTTVTGLLGAHRRIADRSLTLRLDEFWARLGAFRSQRVPGFRAYQAARHAHLVAARSELRLDDYTATVMSAFVRNRLINDVYLPLIGDNLAKQIGTVGEGRRTDQMGLLLLISPPGYGKTTLMEYVAARLGLVFVKVSGPSLGHTVTSLDPDEAPNATSRAEVERINFALEAGSNTLLYLDDIQHTNPELLQKFISLADGTRRAEGVWAGEARTYDLRGKRFAICMAGNPYTESGEAFRVPDMLANRADTYNLGDVIGANQDLFALSYLENALTSNPTLAPLAGRDPDDIGRLVRMADGEAVEADELTHPYSKSELADIVAVLRHMRRIQQVLLAVNAAYIASASQDDAYRTEPPFGLQGSYRNMNKLTEKVVPVMNAAELEVLIDAHYAGEAQTLTTGAEANLLKLAELRGTMTDEQRLRWVEICAGFRRRQVTGDATDPMDRVAAQIALVGEAMTARSGDGTQRIADGLALLESTLRRGLETPSPLGE